MAAPCSRSFRRVFARHLHRYCSIYVPVLATLFWISTRSPQVQATSLAPNEQPISLARSAWRPGGIPAEDEQGIPVPNFVSEHCRVEWYNAHGVKEHDLNPLLTYERGGDAEHTVLEMSVKPPTGMTDILQSNWTGLTYPLSNTSIDFSALRFLEIWVNDFTPDHTITRAKLHIDFGRVSEDAFWDPTYPPDGLLNSEDKNGDGMLDATEDTGLDGIPDDLEPGYDASTNPDPNQDDYAFDVGRMPPDYSRINNTERNGLGNPNARPDTEDLNNDGYPNFYNDYFEGTIDLSDTAFVAIDVPKDYATIPNLPAPIRADNGWRLFRVPVSDQVFRRVGLPSWESVQHARLWVNGMDAPRRIQIGGIDPIGVSLGGTSASGVLRHVYPNPTSSVVTFEMTLMRTGHARLRLYDLHGRLVAEMDDEIVSPGRHLSEWSGKDANGRKVASGIYLFRVEAPGLDARGRVVILR
jgi:hypothetical protein